MALSWQALDGSTITEPSTSLSWQQYGGTTATVTVDAPAPATKGVRIRLFDGVVEQSSITGITALWWDGATPSVFGAPVYATSSASTDADGWLELNIDADTSLAVDGIGFLLLYKADTLAVDDLIFAGRLAVVDIA